MAVSLRRLGKSGPEVPALGLGLFGLSGGYGRPPGDEDRLKLLDRALEQRNTFWDSSDLYGDSEELLGKWFQRTGKRDQIFLASKFGIVTKPQFKIDSSADYCKEACEASLKKLGTEKIDLYYAHRLDPETPIEETMHALAELKAQGKIGHIGLCEVSSSTLRRAYKVAPVAAVQIEYSPFVLDIEGESGTNLLQTCRELDVAIVCYSPLGRGMLTGTATKESVNGPADIRGATLPRFSDENLGANLKLADQFKAFADRKGCTASQLALAWLLRQGDDIIPIPGTKRFEYLESNWASLHLHLSDDEEAEIRKFVDNIPILGHRTVPAGQAFAFVNTKEAS